MHLDLTMYLAEGVLVKVDRASMACSLETRAPSLLAPLWITRMSLPAASKVDWTRTKKPLRRVLEARYPERIVGQPKKGFGIPVSRWLRTIGRDYLRERMQGLPVSEIAVARLWNEHQSRRTNHRMPLWALFVFGAWEQQHAHRNSHLTSAFPAGAVLFRRKEHHLVQSQQVRHE